MIKITVLEHDKNDRFLSSFYALKRVETHEKGEKQAFSAASRERRL